MAPDDNPRAATEIDHFIGVQIRTRRIAVGMSQEEMAEAIGVSFQQVQKYEKGANRVSAAALVRVAKALRCQIGVFVPEADAGRAAISAIDESTLTSLAQHLSRLNPAGRQILVDLASALAASRVLRNEEAPAG